MEKDQVLIDRKAYDDLCEQVRHLTTKAEERSRRIERLTNLCLDMGKEIKAISMKTCDAIKPLEEVLAKLKVSFSSDDESQ